MSPVEQPQAGQVGARTVTLVDEPVLAERSQEAVDRAGRQPGGQTQVGQAHATVRRHVVEDRGETIHGLNVGPAHPVHQVLQREDGLVSMGNWLGSE